MTKIIKKSIELGRSIVLYNPISGSGHFDSWCAIFTSSLVKLGWTVHIITPNKKPILRTLSTLSVDPARYAIYDRDTHFGRDMCLQLRPLPDNSSKVKYILPKHTQRVNTRTIEKNGPSSWINIVKKILRRLTTSIIEISCKVRFFWNPMLTISHLDPLIFSRDISVLERSLSVRPDLILNMYIDQFETNICAWSKFSQISNFNWLCIHFDTRRTFLNHEFTVSDRLKGVLHINEDMRMPEKSTYRWIPDVTLTLSSDSHSEDIQSIKRYAAGRKIVFLGGAISGDKNLSIWYQSVLRSDPKEWLFLQVGRIDHSTLSSQDILYLTKIEQLKPKNLIVLNHYVEDELVFNSYIEICDVVWCLYRTFKRSSNLLTKAASFKKPVLVSAGHLMSERVQRFGIGLATCESDAQSAVDALSVISLRAFVEEDFIAYTKTFGIEAFESELRTLLNEVSKQPNCN